MILDKLDEQGQTDALFVYLGQGDVAVTVAAPRGAAALGFVALNEVGPIGRQVQPVDAARVALIFTNVEALDLVARRLARARQLLLSQVAPAAAPPSEGA